MEKIFLNIISSFTKNYSVYRFKDMIWVVNSDSTDWVVVVSDCGYLWFNYYYFKFIFSFLSHEPDSNKKYIKLWVERELKLKVGKNVHPDILPDVYNWSGDFNLDEVLKYGDIYIL